MKTHQLSCLVAAAEHGSVRMAAFKLGRSPTAVSNALRELEREVGSVLVDRTPDGVVLTEAGRTLAGHARLIIRQIEQARDELILFNDASSSRLSLTVTPWMTGTIVGPALAVFRKRCPGVQIRISEHLGRQYPEVREGRADISLGPTPTDDQLQYLEATPLYSHTHAVIARKGHPAENAKSWDELKGYDWIITTGLRNTSPLVEKLQEGMDDGVQRIHFVDSALCCISMVRSTDMLSLAPWPVIEMPGIRFVISALNLHEDDVRVSMCLITRKDDILSRPAQIFLECLEESRMNFLVSDDPIVKRMSSVVEHHEINI
jgi:DNA-binding transcriptional LysR family regulator